MSSEPWYVAAFREEYTRVYAHRDLPSARREIAHVLALGAGGRVLDLCCGFGRHSLALRERGVEVVGLDLSAELLTRAADLPEAGLLAGRLLRADARALPFAAGSFDSILNLFSSFGYFGAEGDARVAAEMGRVLRSGGVALLDLMNPPRVRAELVAESRSERDGTVLVERRRLRDGGREVVKEVSLTLPDGERRSWCEEVRLYELDELLALMEPRGFALVGARGDFAGAPHDAASERQIVLLRRR